MIWSAFQINPVLSPSAHPNPFALNTTLQALLASIHHGELYVNRIFINSARGPFWAGLQNLAIDVNCRSCNWCPASESTTTWNWDRKAVYNDGVSLFWTKWFQKTVLLLEDFPGMTASSRTDGSELAKGNTLQQRQLPSKLNGEGSILIHSGHVDCSNHAVWNPILTHRVFHIFLIYIVNDIVNLWAGR